MTAVRVPRTRPPDERRHQLRKAAASLFRDRSADSVSVEEITTAAGVSKGLFYVYCPTKAHLLGELKALHLDELQAKIASVPLPSTAHDRDWHDAIGRVISAVVDHDFQHAGLVRAWAVTEPSAPPDAGFTACANRFASLVASRIRSGVAAGAFHCDDPEATARLLIHACEGLVADVLVRGWRRSRRAVADACASLARRALAAETHR